LTYYSCDHYSFIKNSPKLLSRSLFSTSLSTTSSSSSSSTDNSNNNDIITGDLIDEEDFELELDETIMISEEDEQQEQFSEVSHSVPEEDEEEEETQNNACHVVFAHSLEGRLLCSSESAYGIRNPYFRAAHYLPHTQAKKVSRGVNSALIGETVDGIVVAFRGTQPSSPLDWLQNAAVYLKPVKNIPGRIHEGFYGAAKRLYDPIKQILLEYYLNNNNSSSSSSNNNKPKPIYLTGHSKGGSLAVLTALLMSQDPQLPNATKVVSFAAARVGSSEFARYYNENVLPPENNINYENDLDIIPLLPPSQTTMGHMDPNMTEMVEEMMWSDHSQKNKNKHKNYQWTYQPIGKRLYIDRNRRIIDKITPALDRQRILDIEQKTILSYTDFRRAHCSSCPDNESGNCGGGYFMAIAPEVCQQKLVLDGERTPAASGTK